jgi:glycosyltransferase involved in cell wall biosynthesis
MFAKKPFICQIHDVGPFQTNFSRLPFIKWIEIKNAQTASLITTSAESNRIEIANLMKTNLEKIYAVSSAIDPVFHPDPKKGAELKSALGLNGPVIYYVGRLEFYKGIDSIISAYLIAKKSISNLNLVIGGMPSSTMQTTIEQWKQQYPEIKFIGMVPDNLMVGYYSMADVFVTYSFASEGFGLTPIEALACGTPVIASTLPAYKEALQNAAIFVEPKRPELLAQAFIDFFKDSHRREQLLKEAQTLIQRYRWETVVDLVENVFQIYLKEHSKN